MKPWYQSKTLWTNITLLVGTVAGYFTMGLDLKTTLAMAGAAVVNMGLRMVTCQPISDLSQTPKNP